MKISTASSSRSVPCCDSPDRVLQGYRSYKRPKDLLCFSRSGVFCDERFSREHKAPSFCTAHKCRPTSSCNPQRLVATSYRYKSPDLHFAFFHLVKSRRRYKPPTASALTNNELIHNSSIILKTISSNPVKCHSLPLTPKCQK